MSDSTFFHLDDVTVQYDLIIPNIDGDGVLLLFGEDGWHLPRMFPHEHHFGVVGHLQQAIFDTFGLRVATLRCLSREWNENRDTLHAVYLLDTLDAAWSPTPPWRWIRRSALGAISLSDSSSQSLLMAWANEEEAPPARVSWARHGWMPTIESWIATQLASKNIELTAPIEQYRAWSISCLLRIQTDDGLYYCKAAPPFFAIEPALTASLARIAPAQTPDVAAHHQEKGWLLMRASAGHSLNQEPIYASWETTMSNFAAIQMETVTHADDYRRLGCPELHLGDLGRLLAALLEDRVALHEAPDPRVALADGEIVRLQRHVDDISAMADELAASGLPQAIVHGDFHPGNVLIHSGKPRFIDWSTAGLAHPFFDLFFFSIEHSTWPAGIFEHKQAIEAAYLQPWQDQFPSANVELARQLAQPLGALYYALTFHRVVSNVEAAVKWEMANMVPWMLRILLAHFE